MPETLRKPSPNLGIGLLQDIDFTDLDGEKPDHV